MEDTNAIIDEVAKEHYGHVTPGTPDHFTLSRFLTALKLRLSPAPEPEQKVESPTPSPEPHDGE